MSKRHVWRLPLLHLDSVADAIRRAYQVRVYPSRKHPGVTMLKIQSRQGETTGQLLDAEFAQLAAVLKPFTAIQAARSVTIYQRDARIFVRRYLEYVITAIQTSGWQPTYAREAAPTWHAALALHDDHQPVTPESINRVEEIICRMREPEPTDYGRALAEILQDETAHLADLPLLASAVVSFERRRTREATARVSQHMGTPGQPYQVDFLEVLSRRWVDTYRGQVLLYKLRDAQENQYTLWRDRGLPELPDRFCGEVQILKHTEYLGVQETVITLTQPVTPVEICPACGGRYDTDQCTCILAPEDYAFTPSEFDIEIEEL